MKLFRSLALSCALIAFAGVALATAPPAYDDPGPSAAIAAPAVDSDALDVAVVDLAPTSIVARALFLEPLPQVATNKNDVIACETGDIPEEGSCPPAPPPPPPNG